MKNYYEGLGVDPKAAPEAIRAAYNALARKYRPDLSGSSNDASMMKTINEACECLSSPV
jgi:DnaJ-class molecular chaperone